MLQTIIHMETVQVVIKLLLAVLLSGFIGMERGMEKQAAGFRTHIMVCVGAALVMMTNVYIFDNISSNTDIARLGAQVVTGVGFLGAGTIIVTGRQKVRGLTTAAGLWASACIGLAVGIGFYSGAIVAAILIFFCHTVLQRVEGRMYRKSPLLNMYIEAENMESFRSLIMKVHSFNAEVVETRLSTDPPAVTDGVAFFLILKIKVRQDKDAAIELIRDVDGIVFVEEI